MIFIKILLITVVFLALAFAGFAVKMFFKKDGEFKKQCSTVDPKTGQPLGCSCGGKGDGSCRNEDEETSSKIKIQPLQVD
jgi:hypothetical protein